MLIVHVKENESIEKALRRYKKKFDKIGMLKKLRGRVAFEKPSTKRRKEVLRAAYRQKMHVLESY